MIKNRFKKHKNKITWFLLILGAVGALVYVAQSSSVKKSGAGDSGEQAVESRLVAQELSYNFGAISMAKGKVSHIFKIKNNGQESVTLAKLYTSCMCTTAALIRGEEKYGPFGMPGHGMIPSINKELGAGEEASIEAVFDPTAHGPAGVGKITRKILLENSAGKPLELEFRALVMP